MSLNHPVLTVLHEINIELTVKCFLQVNIIFYYFIVSVLCLLPCLYFYDYRVLLVMFAVTVLLFVL